MASSRLPADKCLAFTRYTRLTMALNPNLLALYGSTAAYQPPPDSNVPQPVTELSASLAAPSQQTSTTPSATSHYGGNAGVATALAGSTAKGSAPSKLFCLSTLPDDS
jgi:hypothetical protein